MARHIESSDAIVASMARRCAFILDSVRNLGLLERRTASVTTRINPELLRLAKEKTGVEANSALIELAVASLVFEDGFPDVFKRSRGRVSPDLDLSI